MPAAEPLPAAYGDPALPRWHPATLRAAWWAARSLRSTRGGLRARGLTAAAGRPPQLPAGATRGVLAVLRRRPSTCLERCLVLQAWLVSHGEPYDVIVGVTRDPEVRAHAWLPFEAGRSTAEFVEMTRVAARGT